MCCWLQWRETGVLLATVTRDRCVVGYSDERPVCCWLQWRETGVLTCKWERLDTWVPQHMFTSSPSIVTTRTAPTWSSGRPRVLTWQNHQNNIYRHSLVLFNLFIKWQLQSRSSAEHDLGLNLAWKWAQDRSNWHELVKTALSRHGCITQWRWNVCWCFDHFSIWFVSHHPTWLDMGCRNGFLVKSAVLDFYKSPNFRGFKGF